MTIVATETHSDARWWPLTWGEAGECSWMGRLGWGIWGIIWRLTKGLASWGGGQQIGRGYTAEGAAHKHAENTLFFLPSSERVAIDTVHLIKTWVPLPSLWRTGLGSCLSCLAIQAQVQSMAGRRQEADRARLGDGGERNLGHMPLQLSSRGSTSNTCLGDLSKYGKIK